MKKTALIWVTSMVIVLLTNCSHEIEDCNPNPAFLDEEMIEYFGCFKKGSWWVYKDSVTGTLDTVKVTEYERGRGVSLGKMGKNNCLEDEFIQIRTNNTKPEYGYLFKLKVYKTDSGDFNQLYLYDWIAGNGFPKSIIGKSNGKFYFGIENIMENYSTKIDVLKIQNVQYENILSTGNIYFAPKIGLVKYVDYIGNGQIRENFELIDYHINY